MNLETFFAFLIGAVLSAYCTATAMLVRQRALKVHRDELVELAIEQQALLIQQNELLHTHAREMDDPADFWKRQYIE